jgi:hypothetical protein
LRQLAANNLTHEGVWNDGAFPLSQNTSIGSDCRTGSDLRGDHIARARWKQYALFESLQIPNYTKIEAISRDGKRLFISRRDWRSIAKMVSRFFTSWNQMVAWFRRIEGLRRTA